MKVKRKSKNFLILWQYSVPTLCVGMQRGQGIPELVRFRVFRSECEN